MEEIHLFIIWENALYKKQEILEDIEKNFEILKKYIITWDLDKFSENLSRFYGTNLPKGSGKEQHCGTGPFMLIIVKDKNPKYEKRGTSKGDKIVNTNMFDKKTYYREITGGGHKIHATNDVSETNHDLTLLIDKSIQDFLKENIVSNEEEKINKNLIGAKGWKNANEMFYVLNNCTNYALLRNYENLPEEIYVNDHNDIDLICRSKEDCAYILNAKKVFNEEYRVHYVTEVEGKNTYFDLRYVGDNYYDEDLEEEILKTRVWNNKGFFTVNNYLYFYTLLYHALLHKNQFAEDYKIKLVNMHIENINENTKEQEYINLLNKWLLDKEYIIKIPQDKSVLFNTKKANMMSRLIYRNEEELLNLKDKNIELQEENNLLKNKNKELELELNKMVNSISWKSTKWIRDFHTSIKRKKN